jgi:hypothetical protein
MNIYIDTDIFDHIIQIPELNIVRNLSEFVLLAGPKKALFHAPFPKHLDFDNLKLTFNRIYNHCDEIILLVSELHDVTMDFIQDMDRPKITLFLNGDINVSLKHSKQYHWDNWFETTMGFYKKNQFLLDKLNPYTVKPKYFDILLGQERIHRTELFSYVNDNKLNDQMIMTYMITPHTSFQTRQESEWVWEVEGLEIPDWPMRHTVTKVKYYDQLISLSQIIPVSIYNQTAYTIVAETWGTDNRFTFNTEKIVKPILAKRLFLVASNQYYLRNLRAMGFKTFDSILDESYDVEPDVKKRCDMIGQQIQYLINQPQEKILEQIRPIVEHNQHVMLKTDWIGDFARELRAVLLDHTRQN